MNERIDALEGRSHCVILKGPLSQQSITLDADLVEVRGEVSKDDVLHRLARVNEGDGKVFAVVADVSAERDGSATIAHRRSDRKVWLDPAHLARLQTPSNREVGVDLALEEDAHVGPGDWNLRNWHAAQRADAIEQVQRWRRKQLAQRVTRARAQRPVVLSCGCHASKTSRLRRKERRIEHSVDALLEQVLGCVTCLTSGGGVEWAPRRTGGARDVIGGECGDTLDGCKARNQVLATRTLEASSSSRCGRCACATSSPTSSSERATA